MTEDTSTAKILIIEDEALIAREIQHRLTRMGWEVVGMAFGREAIELAVETQPDLLLSDIHLRHGLSGIDLAKEIQEIIDVPVVFLTARSGLLKWDNKQGNLIPFPAVEIGLSDIPMSMVVDANDVLWVGTFFSGLNRVSDGEVVEVFQHDPFDEQSLSSNAITDMFIDSKNRMWISTYGGGINLYLGGGKFKRYPDIENPNGTFSDLRCTDVAEDNEGRLWISTGGGGVMVLDPVSADTKSFRNDPDDESSIVSDDNISILITDQGVWIGSLDHGLSFYDYDLQEFVRYTTGNGLVSNAIYGILEDSKNDIWISHTKGLSVLDPHTGYFTNFNSSHGLQEGDFTSGAALKLADGSMLFGGNNGFNAYYPNRIRQNTHIPPVRITGFELRNKSIELSSYLNDTGVLELKHNDRVIGFEFAALDYTAPERNQYRYKLDGFDREWIHNGNDRDVTYTNLDAGNYVFRVLGSNNDGIWNEQGASVEIIVHPAPWLTWWAFTLYSALALFLFYQLLQFNGRRLQLITEEKYNNRIRMYIETLDEASECVLIADKKANLIFTNRATVPVLSKSTTEVMGMPLYSTLFQKEEDAEDARQQISEDGKYQGEVGYLHPDESSSTLEVTITAVDQISEDEVAFFSIAKDVSERKKAEEELLEYQHELERLVSERTDQLEKEITDSEAIRIRLSDSLEEKEALLKEIHHRVNNNLQVITSLLNIQANKASDANLSEALSESQHRIKSMALVHENMYHSKNLKHIDLESYIDVLTTGLIRSHARDGLMVHLEKDIENVDLDIARAVPCGLIVNELVTNVLKHAFVGRTGIGRLKISFVPVGTDYLLTVSDDGIGLPINFQEESSSSMGMEIISILTIQLDGQLKFIGERDSAFEVRFPRVPRI